MKKEEIPQYVRDELSQTKIGREALQVIEMQCEQIARLEVLVYSARDLLTECSVLLKEDLKQKAKSWRNLFGWL